MSTSEDIRFLAREGLSVAEIAQRLSKRYQHVYNVLNDAGMLSGVPSTLRGKARVTSSATVARKPPLTVMELVAGGFQLSGHWILSEEDELTCDRPLPTSSGVYAFAIEDAVVYVGVATIGLAKRLKSYSKPGPSQRVNQRLNGRIKTELLASRCVEIYTAKPDDFTWNGFPVSGCTGLENGLLRKYKLP